MVKEVVHDASFVHGVVRAGGGLLSA